MTDNSNCPILSWNPENPSPTQNSKQTGKQQNSKTNLAKEQSGNTQNSKDTPTKTTCEFAMKSTNSNQEIDPQLDVPSF